MLPRLVAGRRVVGVRRLPRAVPAASARGRRNPRRHADRLSNDLAAAFADRLLRETPGDVPRQVELAYRLATGRPPDARERALAAEFLARQPLGEFALAMLNLNAFLYVE